MNGHCRTNAVEGCYWILSLYAMRNPTNLASSTILAIHQRNTAIPSLCPLLGSPDPVIGPGDRPKRPTDEMDRAPHAGALLFRLAQPRQLHQLGQFLQAGIQGGCPLPCSVSCQQWGEVPDQPPNRRYGKFGIRSWLSLRYVTAIFKPSHDLPTHYGKHAQPNS
jgi:hypothetical protein